IYLAQHNSSGEVPFMEVIDQIREAIRSASSVVEVPRKKAESLAREVVKRGEGAAGSVSSLAEEIVKRSRENAEGVRRLVSSEVRRQIKSLGLATKEDVDRLSRRVRELETRAPKKSTTRTSDSKTRKNS
ncbi:MAG: phasin family protein, partial [Acidimicrobiia bacterium]